MKTFQFTIGFQSSISPEDLKVKILITKKVFVENIVHSKVKFEFKAQHVIWVPYKDIPVE